MKKTLTTIYAVFCTLLLVAGFVCAFYFAWQAGITDTIGCVCGLLIGVIVAPTVHELGHVAFASATNMEWVYTKFFCFKIYQDGDKKRFAFASPLEEDRTQAVPKSGGSMQKRAMLYTAGGLIFGGVFLLIILAAAILAACLGANSFLLWGILPYAAYLTFLNVLPCEYASGKTDMLVLVGLQKGYDTEKNMLSAMEIQGQLYEGKSFSEIGESYYYDVPQLCEDDPLYAVMLDLRYRYHLEKGETDKAVDALTRLTMSQVYLPDSEMEKIAAEVTYMHSLQGNLEYAQEMGEACYEFLQGDSATAKRVLAAFSAAFGKEDAVPELKRQAQESLGKERILGVRKFEEILLSRI